MMGPRYAQDALLSYKWLIYPVPQTPRKEVDTDPSWREILRRLRRITPYLWPKNSRPLQLIAVCPDPLPQTKH